MNKPAPDRGHPSSIEALVGALQFRSILIVLDNCEHLVRACAEVAQALVYRCAGLRILATSRESLRISGELVRPVLPLATPDPGQTTSLVQLAAYPVPSWLEVTPIWGKPEPPTIG